MTPTRPSIFILAALGIILSFPAHAKTDIHQKLAEEKAKSEKLEKKSKELNAEVAATKKELISTTKSIRDIEDSLSEADEKLKALDIEEQKIHTKLADIKKSFGSIVTAAKKQAQSQMALMLQSSPSDAAKTARTMKFVLPGLEKDKAAMQKELEELQRVQTKMAEGRAAKYDKVQKYNEKEKELKVLIDKRTALYSQTEGERKKQETEVQRLAKEARNLEDLVSKIRARTEKKASSYHLPAKVPLPVQGTILTGFNEKDDLGAKSKGLTFSVRPGATVLTPLAGKVKFAGPFQKHRQILIIEHAGGYHSLIAGLGRIDTVVGASLDAGEPVGTADDAGPEARVYYELRQNGDPVNPQKLLAAQRKQDKI